jgi:hypothetical protein
MGGDGVVSGNGWGGQTRCPITNVKVGGDVGRANLAATKFWAPSKIAPSTPIC